MWLNGEKANSEEVLDKYSKIVGYTDHSSSYEIGTYEDKFAIYYWIDGESESIETFETFEEAQNEYDSSVFFNPEFEDFDDLVKENDEAVKSFHYIQ